MDFLSSSSCLELLLLPSSPVSGLYLTITCAIKLEMYSVHFIKQMQVKMNTFILTEMMIFSLWYYWIALLIIVTLLWPVITFPEIFPLTSMEIELPSWFWRFCVLWLKLFLKWIKAFFVHREKSILNVILFFLILFFFIKSKDLSAFKFYLQLSLTRASTLLLPCLSNEFIPAISRSDYQQR